MIFRHLHLKRIAIILLITLVIIVVVIGTQVSVLKFYPDKRIEHLERTHNEILSRLGSIEEYQRNPFAPAIDRAKQAIVYIIHDTNERVIGLGSGILIDKNQGYILTNYHVIENKKEDQIKVIFPNNDYRDDIAKGVPTSIIGYDRLSDLALLKSMMDIKDKHRINEIEWGNSKNLQVGEHAIAIGYPHAPEGQANPTITAGIISATSRNFLKQKELYLEMIQTDAPINKGNSGGALVNIHGQLIGINTIVRAQPIYLRTQEKDTSEEKDTSDISFIKIPVAGMGFAIPAHNVRKVVEQLIAHGCVIPPYLGIHTQPVTSDLREKTGILYGRGYSTFSLPWGLADDRAPNYSGVYVADIDKGSPADNAGLKHGALIEYWGKLEEKLQEYKEKDIEITFYSGITSIINETHFKTLTRLLPINQDFYFFFRRPIPNPNPKSEVSETPYINSKWLPAPGVKLQPKVLQWNYTPPGWGLTFKQPNREEYEKYKNRGVIVTNILPDSPLVTNLKSGDLVYKIIRKKEKEEITVVNDQENEIHSLEEFTIRTSNLTPGEDFWFHFERDGKNQLTLITIPNISLKKVLASPEEWKKATDWEKLFNSLEPKSEEKRKIVTDWEKLFNSLEPKSVNPLKSE